MQVNPSTLNQNQQADSIGYVGSTVQWIVKKIASLIHPIFTWMGYSFSSSEVNSASDIPFDEKLLNDLQKRVVTEPDMLEHFEKQVNSLQRERIYVDLGKARPLSLQDIILNTVWRNSQAVSASYRRKGASEVKKDPYLIAPFLEKALQKKINIKKK